MLKVLESDFARLPELLSRSDGTPPPPAPEPSWAAAIAREAAEAPQPAGVQLGLF
jgi:hypothetical protein